MKKFLVVLLALLCFVPSVLSAEEKAKVKVYIFEAGECPYCEAEVQYLEGLKSYNKKFEIVRKELYVDHETWAEGEDYKLGVKLADAFKKAGFENADYTATPFVIISDLYAAAGYSEDLESVIEEAYEKGDNDIVECAINNAKCTINGKEVDFEVKKVGLGLVFLILFGFVILVVVFLMVSPKKTNEYEDEEEVKEVKREVKAPVKKTPAKKATTKKPVKKSTTKKTTKK